MTILLPAVFAVSFGILLLFTGLALVLRPANPLDQVLAQYVAQPRTAEEIESARPFGERVLTPLLRAMASVITRFTPRRNVEGIRHLLDVAGNPFNWTAFDIIGLRGLSAMILLALAALYLSRANLNSLQRVVVLVIAVVIGFYLPMYWLRSKARARQQEIMQALPDALDLLTISLEAGLGMDAAIQRVTQKWDNALSQAFARVLGEIRVGKLRREALRDMADRMEVIDVSNFVAALIQAEQMGSSLINFMRIHSEDMRNLRRSRAQEQGQKAAIKILFPLILFIFPALMIVIIGPTVIKYINSPLFRK